MNWTDYTYWHSLYADSAGSKALARVYTPGFYPKWTVAIITVAGHTQLDPALTLDEAKLVVQTLVGSRS